MLFDVRLICSKHLFITLLLALGVMPVNASDEALDIIIAAHWAWTLDVYPERRQDYGDSSGNRLWTDVSPAAHASRAAQQQRFIHQLETIEPATLSEQAGLNRAMLLRELRDDIAAYELGLHLMPVTMRTGPQHRYAMAERLTFNTEEDYRDWLVRLQRLPAQLEGYTELLHVGIEQNRVQARIVMQRVPGQIDRLLTDRPEDSPFYEPFKALPETLTSDVRIDLQTVARDVISNDLNPAYERFKRFIQQTYLPATRTQVGLGSLPGGQEAYRQLVRQFTTTEMTPEDIHKTGLREVARIRAEMEGVIKTVGFDGDIQAFNHYLRSSPAFYHKTPEALLEAYQAIAKRLDPELVRLFGRLPRMPYGVRPIPAAMAPDTTTAYYMQPAADGSRPGWYYVNLYRPEVRPIYEMEVLSVHESVPGHHLQIALAQELSDLPEFRRDSHVTAFVEGWGLYAEQLGYAMGLYQDPYSQYGQLVYDMWRAVRLVVDTGMHAMGWSRERAIEYFKANAAKTEADIINEIDRYIGWPGQALAYKIGQLTLLELRSKAEAALGERFDIRAFHDHLLSAGALPMDVLTERMDRWLNAQLARQ